MYPVGDGKCCICAATYKNHSWGKTAAHKDGWFFSKDGIAYCPEHLPVWVPAWREKNAKKGH